MVSNIGERIKAARKSARMGQAELGAAIGIGKSSISEWESGKRSPDIDKVHDIARALGVTPAYLMGWDESPALPTMPANIVPVQRHTVPLLGEIAAGQPIYADEEHDLCVAVDDDIRCDFALRVRGDSMIDAGIYDGDVVLGGGVIKNP